METVTVRQRLEDACAQLDKSIAVLRSEQPASRADFPQDEIGRIHDRMPMVIESARWADWLDPAASSGQALHGLLAPAAVTHLTSYPVSTEVNSVRHNGPGLIEPLAGSAPGTLF